MNTPLNLDPNLLKPHSFTIDVRRVVDDAVARMQAAMNADVEAALEQELVEILRAKGYTVTPPTI